MPIIMVPTLIPHVLARVPHLQWPYTLFDDVSRHDSRFSTTSGSLLFEATIQLSIPEPFRLGLPLLEVVSFELPLQPLTAVCSILDSCCAAVHCIILQHYATQCTAIDATLWVNPF